MADATNPRPAGAVGIPGAPGVTLGPVGIASAWNVQGAGAAALAPALFGTRLPTEANTLSSGPVTALWLGPASWLLVTGAAPLHSFEARRDTLNDAGGALFDVSASRVAFVLHGPRAQEVLAAGCPLDFDPRVFGPGCCAQSVYDRVNALYANVGGAPAAIVVMVARSFGRDVWHGLCTAASEFGYDVGPARPWPGMLVR